MAARPATRWAPSRRAWMTASSSGEDINAAQVLRDLLGGAAPPPTSHRAGHSGTRRAFAEQLSLPITNLHRVPDGVFDEAAVFVELFAAACQILEQVHVRPSHRVVVLGWAGSAGPCASCWH